jgi:cytochrome P450
MLMLCRTIGTVVRVAPSEVDFSSVSGAKRIHSYRDAFRKSAFYDSFVGPNKAPSVFNMRDPDQHGKRRRLLSSPMAESNLKNLEGFIKEKVDRAIDRIGEEMKKRGAADVLKWWSFLTTDVIGQLSFGQGFDMLEVGKVSEVIFFLQSVVRDTLEDNE